MTPSTPERILAVRVGRAGDLVMITPALRMLLDAFPAAEFHLLTSADGRRTLRGFDPRLTAFHTYERKFPAALTAPARLARELAAHGYTRAYVFETHDRYRHFAARVAPRVFMLEDRAAVVHYSARCLDVVEASLDPQGTRTRGWATLPVTEAGRAAAAAYLDHHGLQRDDRLVGIHMTFSESARGLFAGWRGRKHRMWPFAEAAALARLLAAQGLRPVVDVLPAERELLAGFLAEAGDAVTVLSGAPDFERYKAVLERLDALVTPNTGPMHMAAAVGTPVVALFSGWSPADCGPYAPAERVRVLRAEDTPEPGRGLAAISAAEAAAACVSMIGVNQR